MSAGRVTAWQAFTAGPRWTVADGVRPGWARFLVPARDTPRRWVWLNLLLVLPTAAQVALAPRGEARTDQYVAVFAASLLLFLAVRRGVLALVRD